MSALICCFTWCLFLSQEKRQDIAALLEAQHREEEKEAEIARLQQAQSQLKVEVRELRDAADTDSHQISALMNEKAELEVGCRHWVCVTCVGF